MPTRKQKQVAKVLRRVAPRCIKIHRRDIIAMVKKSGSKFIRLAMKKPKLVKSLDPVVLEKAANEWTKLSVSEFEKKATASVVEVTGLVGETVGATLGIEKEFFLEDAAVIEFTRKRGLELATTVGESLKPTIRNAMADALKEGLGEQGVYDAIKGKVKDSLEGWKIDRISRTEGSFSANRASRELYLMYGSDKLEWMAVVDDRTSEACLDLNGKVIDITAEFGLSAGSNLSMVGGAWPTPPQHPNCRCVIVPIL